MVVSDTGCELKMDFCTPSPELAASDSNASLAFVIFLNFSGHSLQFGFLSGCHSLESSWYFFLIDGASVPWGNPIISQWSSYNI